MKESLESRLGLLFAFAIIAALVILESLGSFTFFRRGHHVFANFKDIQDLKLGAPVKMAGVQVGRVRHIALTNGLVNVEMDLNRDADVRLDSKASVKFTGLLGQNFVNVDFGEGVPAAEGATLQVAEQPDFGQLMVKLENVASGVENLTKSFSGERIDNLLGPVTDFMKANSSNLTATIANVRLSTERIASGQGTVGKLINEDALYNTAMGTISNFQGISSQVTDVADQARELMTNANQVVAQVNAGHGTIGKLVHDEALYNETTGSMTNLHEILLKINHGQGSVGKLINDDSLLKNAKLSLQKLDKATESLEDTGPLSVLGTMASSLF
ncbi:MAG TPA: MlaD family protein [Verrucomicrobiae bacterium]|jgi:phospholipid/cholesterol/gamma-HCH transport system substrate-binding protein|nr:MlaD family protein [Verrucomicrobiae bacterium]